MPAGKMTRRAKREEDKVRKIKHTNARTEIRGDFCRKMFIVKHTKGQEQNIRL